MNTSDEQWWDAQCGEYVLGTLRGVERDVFEKILESDHDAQARVDFWNRYLSVLDRYIQATSPPEHTLSKILLRVRVENATNDSPELSPANEIHDLTSDWSRDLDETLDANANLSAVNHSPASVDRTLEQHRNRNIRPSSTKLWKTLSLIFITTTLALAAVLLKQLELKKKPVPDSHANQLSFIQDAENNALWLITLHKNSNQATVVSLAPPPIDSGKSYQLWVLHPDDGSVNSLGQLPGKPGKGSTINLPAPADYNDVFWVSIETISTSPQSVPTGPMLFSGKIQSLASSNP